MEQVTLTRKELYDLVWTEPISKLAPRFGVSDVTVAKTCRRHGIPRPSRGYWQKKRFGKKVRRTPLRPLRPTDPESLETMTLGPSRSARLEAMATGPVADQIRFEADPKNKIVVPERLGRSHPLVRQTRERKRAFRRDDGWDAVRRMPPGLNVSVERSSFGRALRILNALIKALEKRGYTVSVTRGERRSKDTTRVTIQGVDIAFRLFERKKRVEREPTEWEKNSPWRTGPYYDFKPSGRLTFEIEDWHARGARKTWTDGKKQRLENCLNQIIVGLVRTAVARKEWEIEREDARRRRQEEEERRRELERKREEERRRGQQLEADAAAWLRARRIRAFIRAVARVPSRYLPDPWDSHDQWATWAQAYVDRLDPLSSVRA